MASEIEQANDLDSQSAVVEPTKTRLLGVLGAGLITGASDDDPSGIATYSQAGAQFGYALTWTMLFTYPLMTAVQIVSARMGRTTGRGIAGNLRQHCPPRLLTAIVTLLLIANAINIGADLGAMADTSRLVLGGPQVLRAATAARCLEVPHRQCRDIPWLTISQLRITVFSIDRQRLNSRAQFLSSGDLYSSLQFRDDADELKFGSNFALSASLRAS